LPLCCAQFKKLFLAQSGLVGGLLSFFGFFLLKFMRWQQGRLDKERTTMRVDSIFVLFVFTERGRGKHRRKRKRNK